MWTKAHLCVRSVSDTEVLVVLLLAYLIMFTLKHITEHLQHNDMNLPRDLKVLFLKCKLPKNVHVSLKYRLLRRIIGNHLVLAALTGLQAGQDLALDDMHPGVSLLVWSGFEMPRLPRQRHDGELKVLLLFCWRDKDSESDHTHHKTFTCFPGHQSRSRTVLAMQGSHQM